MSAVSPSCGEETCAAATSGRYRVVDRRSFGPYALLSVLAPPLAAVARPGQFVMVAVPGPQFRLRRPLSIHSVYGERLRLLVEPRGEGTRELSRPGSPTWWRSPALSATGFRSTRSRGRCSSAAASAWRRCSSSPTSCAAAACR